MTRKHVTLYLGDRETTALTRCPTGMKRGRWLNLLAAQLAGWSDMRWDRLMTHLAPRPEPVTGKLTIGLPGDLARDLDRKRGHVPLIDVLRTALLHAAEIDYEPVPMSRPFAPMPPPKRLVTTAAPEQPDVVRGPAPELVVFPAVENPPDDMGICSWRYGKAKKEAVWDLVEQGGRVGDGDLCFPDLTSGAQFAVAERLITDPSMEPMRLWLGILGAPGKTLNFLGLAEPERTETVLQSLIENCFRSVHGHILRYAYGPEPEDVVLRVTLTMRSQPAEGAVLPVRDQSADEAVTRHGGTALQADDHLSELENRITEVEQARDQDAADWLQRDAALVDRLQDLEVEVARCAGKVQDCENVVEYLMSEIAKIHGVDLDEPG